LEMDLLRAISVSVSTALTLFLRMMPSEILRGLNWG
jgi:hypothetical protein